MIQPLLVFSNSAIFILRVVVGLVLMRHGLPKLKNIKGTGEWLQGVGFRPGNFWAVVAGLVEFVGGLALVLGFLTQLASVFIAVEFLVILVKFKKDKMFAGESEIDWLILAAALILMTLGSGALSLERFLGLILY
ncbi:MAG: DoxX family protein [Candidatus Jorgensenbacteria bacterium GW2011_GWA1_48_13]|uniref:DoxX family protein n=2 Tax=Candidatus Joergenseniibacteriota TaxID=1752739 RepID=A0A0G1W7L8_9BACT|nr:MAG: DoxX family protein [Candidatus Jorgensenbacteria bacterium GW2011_GWA1_48_13]KKU98685.1 MAG: DoxX family protein [Candidatus Jorgensenbacteria bacterium GW2011_GWC1_48_8]KKW14761.1 MAG: DoxX family protein [Candidatus Jorgensenbacteria bacterium GW2011_GWB1_50_10]